MDGNRQRGGAGLLLLAVLVLVLASAGAAALSSAATSGQRERATERSLAQAREALVGHAADRPIDPRVGPGYLPCPDLDDDGWAEPTCGSLNGHLGQAERLGRLPWKTLGLPDLRDGHGERLWYAVSTRFKGLLNCAASAACVDMTPASALGTITVRDATGATVHDGTLADPARAAAGGAAAVVFAPGPALRRRDGHLQRRDCAPGDCDTRGRCIAEPPWRAARCDPRNYLDASATEDNAEFRDRSDLAARAGNANGFVEGPARISGELVMNDRIAPVAFPDVMARVMSRVALELASCVRRHASPGGSLAPPDPECGPGAAPGRVGDAVVEDAAACNAGPGPSGWWAAWKPHVLYARAPATGLEVADAQGRALVSGRRFAIVVTQRSGDCARDRFTCDADGCARVIQPARSRDHLDALVASP